MTTPIPAPAADAALYAHIRVMVSIILGLAVARLLSGLARFAQHPGRLRAWWVHLGWCGWTLLSTTAFWWWEFRLAYVPQWSFGAYLIVLAYAAAYFALAAMLLPDDIGEYAGFEDYFLSRRRWIFAVIAVVFVLDLLDTGLKGAARFQALGPEYVVRFGLYMVLCAVGSFSRDRRVQAGLMVLALGYQAIYIARFYGTLA
ncbi:hypothetical protein [Caulobacter sp. S45]|jgi:hypothetical protein|uniref:hypothetical protein n=1 Tax=Caulobacter sp. S45 TaxID=1641861 RepID=UPI00131D677F|nr:hypothetical protein [Caulobacter sp. S45]